MDIDRNAATVIPDRDALISMDRDGYLGSASCQGFINLVVHNFID